MKTDRRLRSIFRKRVLIPIILMIIFTAIPAYAQESYPPAKALPALTGNYKEDLISVCYSQLGYTGSDSGYSVYGSWAGQPGRPWCSEFVAWCARKAGIPATIIPTGTSTRKYMEIFSRQDRLYIPEGNSQACTCRKYTSKTIPFSGIKRGDIIFKETDGNYSNGPDHTALVLENEGNQLYVISGNTSNTVKINYCPKEKVHSVARPCYEKAASAALVRKTKLRIKSYKVSGKKIRLNYSGINDSNVRYQIAYKPSGSSKWRTRTASKKSILLTKLKPRCKYKVRIRAYYKIGKNALDIGFGSWSKIRTIKTKS